jgi:NADH-quinone oxidoreductase subunit L
MSATLPASTLLAVPLAPLAGSVVAGLFGTVIGERKVIKPCFTGVMFAFINISGEVF